MADKGLAASSENTHPVPPEQEATRLLRVSMPVGLIDRLKARAREKRFANLADAVRTVLASWALRDEVADAVAATPVSITLELIHPEDR